MIAPDDLAGEIRAAPLIHILLKAQHGSLNLYVGGWGDFVCVCDCN